MSEPFQEAKWLIRTQGPIQALKHAKEQFETSDRRPALVDAWWHAKVVYGYIQGYCDALGYLGEGIRGAIDRDHLEALGYSDDEIILTLYGESNDNDQ